MDKIAKKLAAIEKGISVIKESMSTKKDMKTLESELRGEMGNLESGLRGDMKTLESGLREDMKTLEVRLVEKIDEAQMEIIATVDKHKADKETTKVLEKRVERLEENAGLPPYLD